MSIKKILNYLLIYPHYRMNIFSGTNSFEEIKNIYNKLNSINIVNGKDIEKYEIKLPKRGFPKCCFGCVFGNYNNFSK